MKVIKRGDGFAKRFDITPGRQWDKEIRPRRQWEEAARQCQHFDDMDLEPE